MAFSVALILDSKFASYPLATTDITEQDLYLPYLMLKK